MVTEGSQFYTGLAYECPITLVPHTLRRDEAKPHTLFPINLVPFFENATQGLRASVTREHPAGGEQVRSSSV